MVDRSNQENLAIALVASNSNLLNASLASGLIPRRERLESIGIEVDEVIVRLMKLQDE